MSNETIEAPTLNLSTAGETVGMPQVIRRDLTSDASGKPRVVGWMGHKIGRRRGLRGG